MTDERASAIGRVWTGFKGLKDRPLAVVLGAALIASVVARFSVGVHAPLWIDEAWTGAIAGQSDWPSVLRQTWLDANAPFYYAFMHLWIGLFGQSDAALRLPSILIGASLPLLALFLPAKGLEREDRMLLAGMLAVWIEGISQGSLARCYPFLLAFALVQTLAFVRLLNRQDLKSGAIFALCAALTVTTHYQALMLTGAEGLVLIGVMRLKVLRLAPAALAFAPALAVLLWHAPRLAQFARPDVAWYDLVDWDTVGMTARWLIGSPWLYVLPGAGLLGLVAFWATGRERPPTAPWLAALASVGGLFLMLGVGAFRPSFSLRYATPMVPGIFLGVALSLRALTPAFTGARAAFLLLMLIACADWTGRAATYTGRLFNYEIASRDLLATHPSRLVFVWDHPAQAVEDPSQYAAAGGYFFKRAGSKAEIVPVLFGPGDEPNQRLLRAAQAPGSVILWLYDTGVRGTFARTAPPRISDLDPSFGCRQYGAGRLGVYACARPFRK